MRRKLAFVMVALSVAATAFAQKDLARERVSLMFEGMPVEKVLPQLARSLGYEIALDPQLQALITLHVDNVTAQTALNVICESIGCTWRREKTRLIVSARSDIVSIIKPNEKIGAPRRGGANPMTYSARSLDEKLPFDITWSPVDVQYAFHALARMYDAAVDIDAGLQQRKLAVTIHDVTLRQAFDAICRVASCRWDIVERPKRVVRVTARAGEAAQAGSEGGQVYEANEPGVTPPLVSKESKPSYTREARDAKIQGTVVVSCVVRPDGSVDDVKILVPLDPGLDAQAVQAAQQWRFKPGTKDGKPVPVRITMEMTFTLR